MTRKTESDEGSKTWKERMEELISQSKKAKVKINSICEIIHVLLQSAQCDDLNLSTL